MVGCRQSAYPSRGGRPLCLGRIDRPRTLPGNLTIGVLGTWNLGQLAIIAVGGYVTGLLTTQLGLSAWLALPAGALAGGLIAMIIVLAVVRLRGIYAAVLTLAFAEVVRLLIIADHSGLTGGRFGLSGVGRPADYGSVETARSMRWMSGVG